jgi:hypothetical protein
VSVLGTVSKDFIILSVSKTVQCQNEGHSYYLNEAFGLKICCFYIYMTLPSTVVLGIYLFGRNFPTQEKTKRQFWGGGRKGEKHVQTCTHACGCVHMHVWCKFLTWNLDHKRTGTYSAIFL